MNVDQMLALAQLENSNITMGFRSDAVIAYEAAQAQAQVKVEVETDPEAALQAEDDALFDAMSAGPAQYAVLDKHGREQLVGTLKECNAFLYQKRNERGLAAYREFTLKSKEA